jgi:hypothetical protein
MGGRVNLKLVGSRLCEDLSPQQVCPVPYGMGVVGSALAKVLSRKTGDPCWDRPIFFSSHEKGGESDGSISCSPGQGVLELRPF